MRIDLLLGELVNADAVTPVVMFQYPRADRLIVGGRPDRRAGAVPDRFSILVRIDLLLGAPPTIWWTR